MEILDKHAENAGEITKTPFVEILNKYQCYYKLLSLKKSKQSCPNSNVTKFCLIG